MIVLVIYLFSIFIFGIIVGNIKDERIKKIYLAVVFLFAFFYSAFRASTVGADTGEYFQIYNNVNINGLAELPRNTEIEKGFMFLCFCLSRITADPQVLIILMSAVITYAFYFIIRKYSKNYMISSLIFASMIFMATMNISRQFFALAFIIFAISFALDKKPLKTILMIAIAVSMHNSALVFLPLILLSFPKIELKPKSTAIVCIISALAIPAYTTLITFATSMFPQYSRFLSSTKYSSGTGISVIFMAFLVVTMLLNIWVGRNENKDNKNNNVYYLFTILLASYIVTYVISTKMLIANRLICYFQISLLIVVPGIVDRVTRLKDNKVLALITIAFFCGYFLNYGCNYYNNNPHSVLPYAIFWDDEGYEH